MGYTAQLTPLTGVVSHVEKRSEVSGSVSNGSGSTKTRAKTTLFRVDERPATCPGTFIRSNGDRVLLVGRYDQGVFQVEALRNMTAGLIYGGVSAKQTAFAYIGGFVCFGIAALSLLDVFGLLILSVRTHTLVDSETRDTIVIMVVVALVASFIGFCLIEDKRQKNKKLRQYLG